MLKEDASLNCTKRWKTMNYIQFNNFRVLPLALSTSATYILWEKGRDLTQSYDKSPYTNRNVKRAKWQHKQRHKKALYFVFKMTTTDQCLLAIICKLLLQIQMYRKKVQGPVFSSQFWCYYTLCLFHFLKGIRIISGLMGAIALAI